MGNLDDIYKVVQKMSLAGIECLVRRWYRQTSSLGDAATMASVFAGVVSAALETITSQDLQFVQVDVQNLRDPSDFATFATPGNGDVSGEYMPSFVAYGFEFPSPNRDIRAGTMRVPGVPEDAVIDGILNPLYQVVVDDVATYLAQVLVAGLDEYTPVLYTPGNVATIGQPESFDVTTAFYTRITSQNTRKS